MTYNAPHNRTTAEFLALVPDAALIAACDEYCALQEKIVSFFCGGAMEILDDDEREAAILPYQQIQQELLEVIADADLRATSLEGMRARARAAVANAGGDSIEGDAEKIAACVLDDLLGKRCEERVAADDQREAAYALLNA